MFGFRKKYIVDKKGRKTAIILSYAEGKKVLDILEEYEAIKAYDKAKAQPSDPVPFNDAL